MSRERLDRRAGIALALLAGFALLGAGRSAWAQNRPSLRGVGDLAGGAVDSSAEAVSDDGAIVVGGSASASGPQAFRWTAAGGIVGLGDLPGGNFNSNATGVSANGSVIVGTGIDSANESRAFRWTAGSGLVALDAFGCLLCPQLAFGNGVSANGLVAVGAGNASATQVQAARWSGGGTAIAGLGILSGGDFSEALGASSTGSTIVGSSDGSAGTRAFRWTSASGLVALPDVPGAQIDAGATDVSDDASVIVGLANTSATSTGQGEAVRWVGPGYASAQLLGALPGAAFPDSRALAVSANGAIVVGTARNASGDDAAFVWDAANGMRELAPLLEQEYGVDLAGWTLREARGVSSPNTAGEFWVVGAGVDPSGDPEGFVALLSKPACNDGVDNDGDGAVDFPADPQCTSKGDRSETADCGDGLDDDGDGAIDYPADPGCNAATDLSERFDCEDGIDDDGDGAVDFPADAGCRTPASPREDPACQNGVDDDGDGKIDFPDDKQCVAADDRSEIADCSDGIDDDGDGAVDFPADPDCVQASDPAEDPQCSDRKDNDGDLATDHPEAYPACQSAADPLEKPACGDGLDDDGDGKIDFPADTGCASATFGSEAPVTLAVGDLLVLDRRSRALFRLAVASGAQQPISSGAQFGAPQGVAVRAGGAVVVADPAGVFEVAPSTGSQRRFADALDDSLSLQLVFDAAGDTVVLEAGGLTRIPFVYGGIAAQAPLLALPAPGLGVFVGDSLARETAGTLLVTGFGTLGDGIFRVAANGSSVTHVTPGFSGDQWNDLALEANGTILAVGTRFGVGPGVFRVNPTNGTRTALSTGAAWTQPTAVAVAPSGAIYVADAGACTSASCSGAQVVQVDPASGARLSVASGGSITGEMDLAVVTARPACANGVDDDGDGHADFPADLQCRSFEDPSESPDCNDGLDDDGDGLVDFPADPGCASATSLLEAPACNDGHDNDGDGKIDLADPNCAQASGGRESSSCGIGAELLGVLAVLRVRRRLR